MARAKPQTQHDSCDDPVPGPNERAEDAAGYAQLAQRAGILKAMKHTEAALMAISDGKLHYKLIDLYVEAMRELETMLDTNMRAGLGTRAPTE